MKREGGESLLPAEFRSTLEAFLKGDYYLKEGGRADAERYFALALLKGALLEQGVREEKARQKEAAQRAQEQKRAELERRAQEEANRLAQAKAREQALALREAEALALREAEALAGRRKAKPKKENVLVLSYTVKRGESLPLIASRPEVYGDRNLWPLIYRANRDQISDPRHIWPGQVLRVPHNLGRDDISEARRYAQERPLH